MSKRFREYQPEQRLLLAPSLEEWLPEGHLARMISDVVEQMDLREIYQDYEEDGRGQAAYHPALLVKLLLYGYCVGRASSRKLERMSWEDVAARYLAANQHPDHDTLAAFRQRHLAALARLFGQVLRLCERAGLVKLRHVAIDGTKMRANASRHRGRSYQRMGQEQQRLEEELAQWLEHTAQVDAEEDAQYGKGCRGDELPAELRTREQRLVKIRQLRAEMEAEARQVAEQKQQEVAQRLAARQQKEQQRGRRYGGRAPSAPDAAQARPKPSAQRNLTDPASRIMKDGATNSFQQSYNAQASVDGQCQIIVGARVTSAEHDREQLLPNLAEVEQQTGRLPEQVSVDCGYYGPDHLRSSAVLERIELFLPAVREPRAAPGGRASRWARNPDLLERLRAQMQQPAAQAMYRLRQTIVEPVFGQIKQARGLRQFWLRGLAAVSAEWQLICLTHNLLKLHRYGARAG